MKIFRKTALLFLTIFCFGLGMQAQTFQEHIPSDASFVMSLNLGNLDKKISFDKLAEYDFFKEMKNEMTKGMKKDAPEGIDVEEMMKNPSEYGMDIMSEIFIFGSMTEENSMVGMLLPLSDSKKFGDFFQKYLPEEANAKKGKMGAFQTMTSEYASAAWNKEMAIFVGGMPTPSPSGEDTPMIREQTEDDEEMAPPPPPPAPKVDMSKKNALALQTYFTKVVNGKKMTSILSNKRFLRTVPSVSDMKVFLDYEWLMKLRSQGGEGSFGAMGGLASMMQGFESMYKDNYYAMDINFNDGQFRMDSKFYGNKKMMDWSRKMYKADLNKNFFKYLPKDMMGYLSFAMDMDSWADGMFEMFEPTMKEMKMTRTEMEDQALQGLSAMGVEMDKKGLYELIKGDMVFAVTGMREFTVKKTQYDEDFNRIEVESKQKLPEFITMMSYGNEENLMKIVQLGVDNGMLGKAAGENAFKLAIPTSEVPMDLFLVLKEGVLFVTNNVDLADGKMKDGYAKGTRLTKEQQNQMTQNSSLFFWDIPRSLNAAADFAKEEGKLDKMSEKMVNVSKQSLESFEVQTDKKILDAAKSSMSLNFVNKKMNALDQMFSYFNEMFLTAMNSSQM